MPHEICRPSADASIQKHVGPLRSWSAQSLLMGRFGSCIAFLKPLSRSLWGENSRNPTSIAMRLRPSWIRRRSAVQPTLSLSDERVLQTAPGGNRSTNTIGNRRRIIVSNDFEFAQHTSRMQFTLLAESLARCAVSHCASSSESHIRTPYPARRAASSTPESHMGRTQM